MPDAEEIVMSEKETKSEKEENKDKEDKLEDDEFLQHILFHKNLTLTKSTLVHFDHTFGKTHPLDVPYPPPELG